METAEEIKEAIRECLKKEFRWRKSDRSGADCCHRRDANYKYGNRDMSDKKALLFSHPRWKDIPKPEVTDCGGSEEEKNDPAFLAFIEREMQRRNKAGQSNKD